MKKDTKDIIRFYDKNIKSYTTSQNAVILKSQINKFIREVQGDKILDIACGPGHDTNYLTKKRFDCLGVDLSKKMIHYAKKKYKREFKVMDFFDLKFKTGTFDGIWCSSALTHVKKKDLKKVLKGFSRVLRKEGVLGIIVPRTKKRSVKKENTRIFTMFYQYELKRHLIRNGFRIICGEIFSFKNMKWIFVVAKKSN